MLLVFLFRVGYVYQVRWKLLAQLLSHAWREILFTAKISESTKYRYQQPCNIGKQEESIIGGLSPIYCRSP